MIYRPQVLTAQFGDKFLWNEKLRIMHLLYVIKAFKDCIDNIITRGKLNFIINFIYNWVALFLR
jgi:hypothetical protein